jgi:KamA family protein
MALTSSPPAGTAERSPQPYRAYQLHNLREIAPLARFSGEETHAMRVVATVLPFKTNSYVVSELIDWSRAPDDPLFVLNFPQRGMLLPRHFEVIDALLRQGASEADVRAAADMIRRELNPHPAGQQDYNVPSLDGERLEGMQHKYRETVLFFPSQGQTCHAYCTFCFRWPQFVGMEGLRFAEKQADRLVAYLQGHPEVQDVLFTGGDPLLMKTSALATYIEPLLEANLRSLHTIRIGSKALAYWPYRFTADPDAEALLDLLSRIRNAGKHAALMAHFNHPRELSTPAVEDAARRLRAAGVQVRTQSPVLAHINDDPSAWAEMWRRQVDLGFVPYYMFVVRDTGARHFFEVPLERAWQVFREAYQRVSGVCRTVRGPSMSALPGKVQILGVAHAYGEKIFVLRFLQGRDPNWVAQPFFASYDPQARWLDDLKPAFREKEFFFEPGLASILARAREGVPAAALDELEGGPP